MPAQKQRDILTERKEMKKCIKHARELGYDTNDQTVRNGIGLMWTKEFATVWGTESYERMKKEFCMKCPYRQQVIDNTANYDF